MGLEHKPMRQSDDRNPETWQTDADQRLSQARSGKPEAADSLFSETKLEHMRLSAEESRLTSEVAFYKSRLDELRKVVPVGAELRAAIDRAAELDGRLLGLRSELSALRRRRRELVEAIGGYATRMEAELKQRVADTDKRLRAVAVEIAAEKQRRTELQRQYEHVSATRKKEIATLESEWKGRAKKS